VPSSTPVRLSIVHEKQSYLLGEDKVSREVCHVLRLDRVVEVSCSNHGTFSEDFTNRANSR
jgi:hypothetical protein